MQLRNDFLNNSNLEYPIVKRGDADIADSFSLFFRWILPKLTKMDKSVLIDKMLNGSSYGASFNSTSHILSGNTAITAMENSDKLTDENKEEIKDKVMGILKKYNLTGMTVFPLSEDEIHDIKLTGWEDEYE